MKKIIVDKFPTYRNKSAKFLLTGLALLISVSLFAQNNASPEKNSISVFANPVFDVLLTIIILLLIVISVLGGALTSVAEATKDKNQANKKGKILSIIALVAFLSYGKTTFAQEVVRMTNTSQYMGLNNDLFYLLISLIGFELLIIMVLINSIKLLVKTDKEIIVIKKEVPSLIERLNASVAIEKEEDIMLDHNYDGIRELDNDLPPWWKYGFYLTIVFAFVYLVHYHVTRTGDLQLAEYDKSIKSAHEAKEEFEKNSANNVTESTAKMITDKHALMEAENTFKETCSACHGKLGEGGVGPNLTDNFWLHGGSNKDIFATIKYGWPDKGMKSWQADLTPLKINEIASYIKTLAGTNPPNGKAPQGDLFTETGMVSESTKSDSTKVLASIVDSTKVVK